MIAKLNALIRGNSDEAEVLRGAAIALVLRGLSGALAFALNVVIARALGAEGAGLYFFSLSVITILSVATRFGLDNSMLRFISASASVGEWAKVRGVYQMGMRLAGLASLGAAALLAGLAPFGAVWLWEDPELGMVMAVMAPSILGLAMMFLGAESLKGLKKIAPAVMVSSLIYPVIAILLVWPLAQRFGPVGAAIAYSLSVSGAALVGYALWRRYTAPHRAIAAQFDRNELMASARPLWTMSLITRAAMPWAPLLILGFFSPAQDVGVYGAATRIAALVTLLLISVNTVISPKFSELYTKGDLEGLGRIARQFARLITLASSPVLLVLIFAGDKVMAVFGPEFTRAGTALAILAAGQAVNAMTGSAGALLMMTGHERELRNASIIAGALVVGLSLALIPIYSLIGAAIATATSVAAMNLISLVLISKKLGISAAPWSLGVRAA
ncbi:MAG: flippase [Pseudomonadota bacterium]